MYKKFTAIYCGNAIINALMRLFTILLILCLHASVFAFAQRINLDKKNATFTSVMKEIKKQSGYYVLYDAEALMEAPRIDVQIKNATLSQALEKCFEGLSLQYVIKDNNIIISKKKRVPIVMAQPKVQQKEISGRVTDEVGQPLEGVTVRIKGFQSGTVTDERGDYRLPVGQGNHLVFSMIGYMGHEEAISETTTTVNVVLKEDVMAMDEVVVVGYSTRRQSELSSAVSIVSGDDLRDVTSNNVQAMLQGKAPGLVVSNPSGDPTAAPAVVIRGSSSITAGSGPLYVVDGIIGGSANPSDVESVTVLKDAAATGLYGSRAANGVVIITTKSGKVGKTKVDFNGSYGVNTAVFGNVHMMNSQQLYEYQRTFWDPATFDRDRPASLLEQNTNWIDLAFRSGITQNYTLAVSSGSEKTQLYISGKYYKEQGTLHNNELQNFNLRSNISHTFNKKLKLDVKLNLTTSDSETEVSESDFYTALYAAFTNMPWDRPYNEDGTVRRGTEPDWMGNVKANFLYGWQYNFDKGRSSSISGDINLHYTIRPDLTFSTYNRARYTNAKGELYYDARTNAGNGSGRLANDFNYGYGLISSNRLNYDKVVGKHSFRALGVIEGEKNYSDVNGMVGQGLLPGLHVMNAASTAINTTGTVSESSFTKGLVQLDYNYANRYFVVGSFINESSSRFGANNRSANFYTIGASWMLSNENFMTDMAGIDQLRLRGSYGVIGNAQIANYAALGIYSFASQYAGYSASFPQRAPNDDLTWEKAKTANIGLDIGLVKRITMNVDIYDKTSDALLLNVPLPGTSGYTSLLQNVGSVQNKGLEINLRTHNLTGKLQWETNVNVAFNRSKVLALNDDKDIIAGAANINTLLRVGEDLNTFYLKRWVGVDPTNGDPLWEIVNTDENGNTGISSTNDYSIATSQIVGSSSPDFTGGIMNELRYKRFSLNAFFNFVSGNLVYNRLRGVYDSDGVYPEFNQLQLSNDESRWLQPGDVTTHPKSVLGGNKNSNQPSSRWLEDGSYIRLRNITLSYELPTTLLSRLKMAKASVFVSGDNLWTGTSYSGMDPEVQLGSGDGVSFRKYPISKKVLFGLNIQL